MTTQRVQAPPVNLKERIAAFQQRNVQQRQSSVPSAGPSASHGRGLRDKIAQFEQKGGVPVPRGSFGLGAPPMSDNNQIRRKGELYGNRIPGVLKPIGSPSRSGSPLPSSAFERRNRSASEDYDSGSPDVSPTHMTSEFASSHSSGEPLSPPLSPSFPHDIDGSPPYSSALSSRKSSFANALEIARRAENASPGKYDTREHSSPRPVSPFLAQRLPPSMLTDEEGVFSTPTKHSPSRRGSLMENHLPSPFQYSADKIADLSLPIQPPQPQPPEDRPTLIVPSEAPSKPLVNVSLLPVEVQGVTRLSFEDMLAQFGDEVPMTPTEQPEPSPVEVRAEEIVVSPEHSPSHLPVAVESKEEDVKMSAESDKTSDHIIEAPKITVVSFEDNSPIPDVAGNHAEDAPPDDGHRDTMVVSSSREPEQIVPTLPAGAPSSNPESGIPTPEHEMNEPPQSPSPDVSGREVGIVFNEEILVDPVVLAQTVVIAEHEINDSPKTSHPLDHGGAIAETLSISDSVSVQEMVPDDPVIQEHHTRPDEIPDIKVETVHLSEDQVYIPDAMVVPIADPKAEFHEVEGSSGIVEEDPPGSSVVDETTIPDMPHFPSSHDPDPQLHEVISSSVEVREHPPESPVVISPPIPDMHPPSHDPEPELHEEASELASNNEESPAESPLVDEMTIKNLPPRSLSSSHLPSSSLSPPVPTFTFNHVYLDHEIPVRPRSISMIEHNDAKALARRISAAVAGHADSAEHDAEPLSPESEVGESGFGTVSIHTHSHSYSHPQTYHSPYAEPDFNSNFAEPRSKPFSFSAVVHNKVTEFPSTSTLRANSRGSPRLATTVYVEPESPGYSDLAELLLEAAKLEKRLLEGDIPSEHRAAARQSLQAMSKFTAAQERVHLRPNTATKSTDRKPLFHRALSSPSAIKTVARARSRDGASPLPNFNWKRSHRSEQPLPYKIPAPTGPADVAPAPPPKEPRSRYFPALRKFTGNSGAHTRGSMSTSSEPSSEDSTHTPIKHVGDQVKTSQDSVRDSGGHQRQGSTLGIGWPSSSPRKNGGSLSRATSFAEKIWKRGRTKSATSVFDVPGPPLPSLPPLVISAASTTFNEPRRRNDPTPRALARPASWASGASTSSASPLEKDFFDAFPSVPQETPVASGLVTPGAHRSPSPFRPSFVEHSSSSALVDASRAQETHLSPLRYNNSLSRSTTLPAGPRANTDSRDLKS